MTDLLIFKKNQIINFIFLKLFFGIFIGKLIKYILTIFKTQYRYT